MPPGGTDDGDIEYEGMFMKSEIKGTQQNSLSFELLIFFGESYELL